MTRIRKPGKGIMVFVAALLLFSVFAVYLQAANDCSYNGNDGTCESQDDCSKVSGNWVAASQGAKGCEKLPSQIRCCIPKEDDGSVTIDASPATVTFKSEPITLVSDKVFLETYDKKSKIIDASKITYEGEPIFENAAGILNNDNPNMGGRVVVTVKVFNNIDEQIDTMTFVMKAGGDLWDYAECGADGKGICAPPEDPNTNNREPQAGKDNLFKKECDSAYSKTTINELKKQRISCYTEKGGSGAKTEIKTDEKNNCVKFEGYECIELKNIKGSILSYRESNKCKINDDCQDNNCCGSTDDYLCCKKNS